MIVRSDAPSEPARRPWTIVAGVLGGLLGWLSGIPAGPLIGAVTVVAALGLVGDRRVAVPRAARWAARILIGAAIGSIVTMELLRTLGGMAIWAVVFSAFMVAVGMLCAWLIYRTSDLDVRTSVMSCAPGGLSEMALLAADVGAQAEVVLALQLMRKLAAFVMAVIIIMLYGVT